MVCSKRLELLVVFISSYPYVLVPYMFVNLGYRENLQLLNDVRVWPARAAVGGAMGNSKVRAA